MSETRSAARRRILRARRRRRALVILILTSAMIATIAVLVPRALTPDEAAAEPASAVTASPRATPTPSPTSTPTPTRTPTPSPEPLPCETDAVVAALADGSDADVIAAFGGGEPFRAAVAAGEAPCIDLHEAGRLWVVTNKRNALEPIDYWPEPQGRPQDTRIIAGGWLLEETAVALDALSAAVADAGAGAIAVSSGFRPYDNQVETYRRHVANRGQAGADLRSARPGHSEHQTGLAVDVVACDASGCGDHDGFGGTAQSDWIAENAWRFGFVVRYEEGRTSTTGYSAEPWHLRYIGRELAEAYAGGDHATLEDFFGLEPAPGYG